MCDCNRCDNIAELTVDNGEITIVGDSQAQELTICECRIVNNNVMGEDLSSMQNVAIVILILLLVLFVISMIGMAFSI